MPYPLILLVTLLAPISHSMDVQKCPDLPPLAANHSETFVIVAESDPDNERTSRLYLPVKLNCDPGNFTFSIDYGKQLGFEPILLYEYQVGQFIFISMCTWDRHSGVKSATLLGFIGNRKEIPSYEDVNLVINGFMRDQLNIKVMAPWNFRARVFACGLENFDPNDPAVEFHRHFPESAANLEVERISKLKYIGPGFLVVFILIGVIGIWSKKKNTPGVTIRE